MTDLEIEALLERCHRYREMLAEAAVQIDVLWRNTCELASIDPAERDEVRRYLIELAGPAAPNR